MILQYKKDFEKTAMGLLSYLPDFKSLENLQDEMKLNQANNEFQLYLYRNNEGNIIGVMGVQETESFLVIRYISLAPGFRKTEIEKKFIKDLIDNNPDKKISALPEFSYLLKDIKNND